MLDTRKENIKVILLLKHISSVMRVDAPFLATLMLNIVMLWVLMQPY
jgi:hypothetical protein